MFCWLRSKSVFLKIFFDFWCHFWFHLAPILRKKRSENRFKKRVPPCLKQVTMAMARGYLTAPLARALLKQETIVRARNVVRIRVHGSGFEKLIGNCCLGWLQLQMFQKKIEKTKRVDVLSRGLRPWWSDTPWAKARRICCNVSQLQLHPTSPHPKINE